MCEPISATTIASLAAAAAGTAVSAYGAKKSHDAQDAAIQAAADKQNALTKQSQSIFNTTLSQETPEQQQSNMATAAANRASEYAKADDLAAAMQPAGAVYSSSGDSTGNRVVADGYKDAVSKVGSYLKQQGLARANMESMGDVAFNNSLLNQNALNRIATLSNFGQGNNSLLPLQMADAAHAGDAYNNVGSLLSGVGMVGGAYGAKKNANIAAMA